MTIQNRALNAKLNNLEACADNAPAGTYVEAKAAVQAIHDASNALLGAVREAGFKALNDDRLRDIEAAMYGYLLEGNPEAYGLMTGEGFGAAMDGPARERVIANTIRDQKAFSTLTQ